MKISDYLFKEKVHQGKNFTIYRTIKEEDDTPVFLKVLDKNTTHSSNVINAIKREYGFLKQFDSEYVIKAVDWIENKKYAGIVLEDINGKPLKDEIRKGRFSVGQFIELADKITKGLAVIHRHNIIHKDINPSNIIWNSQTGRLKIIDFNIASKFDIKVSYPGNPENLQGTLPYISPEQTGRMDRRVDHRSDLYSLGVTFYEMLTGKLPFQHRDPMEIVYAHLARDPEPPHLVDEMVPEILSKIVLRLLAKNPEERYQSTEGLKRDLKKSVNLNLPDFKLGEKDFSGKLQIPEKLYGRDKEIRQMLDIYRAVGKGAKEMIMIAGFSGTGKTALVNEIHTPITKDRGYFISGKFDQLQRTIPYSAFIQALNQFCQLLLTEKQEILAQWKECILQAVGELGKVLIDIVPQLELIIGRQPDVPTVSGEDAKTRFNYVFQRFFQAVSGEEHPLVLFIDDLQWADLASLSLLQVLFEDRQSRYILFIGAYRDNEVSPSHPVINTLEKCREEGREITTIPVKNLTVENVQEWLQDTLRTSSNREAPDLADLIYQKTRGNAFFTIQFLENLYAENLLHFNFKQSAWKWETAKIKKKNITDNVVHLLIRKIQTLPLEVQEVLKLTACIGNVFDLHTLSVISEKRKEEHEKNLEIALIEHLVYPLEGEAYKFVHDRIHQAAYSLIPDKDKKNLHLKIGRLLLKNFEVSETSIITKESEHDMFDIVNHLNMGFDLIEDEQEKMKLARLNLKAGQNAKISAAYKSGEDYLHTAIRLLPGDCWKKEYDLALAVYNEAVQIAYLCGNYTEMENFVEIVLQYAGEISHRSVAYEYRVLGLTAQSREHLSTEAILNIFSSLGVNIPREPGKLQTGSALEKTYEMLVKKGVGSIKDLPPMTDPGTRLVLRLYYIGSVAIAFGSPELWAYITNKMIDLILDHGLTPEVPFIITWYAVLRLNVKDFLGAYQLGEVALDLLDKGIYHEAIKVRSVFTAASYLIGYKRHYKTTYNLLADNYPLALNIGDFEYAGYYLTTYLQFMTDTDVELSIIKEKGKNLSDQIMRLTNQALIVAITAVQTSYASSMLDGPSKPVVLDLTDLRDVEKNIHESAKLLYTFKVNFKTILLKYLFEDFDNFSEYIKTAEDNWNQLVFRPTYDQSFFHFYFTLVYIQLYTRTESKENKDTYLRKTNESIKMMKEWAEFGPVNFLHKYYLMQAELYRVTGKNNNAAEYYDKAVEKAYENEYINEAAMANELAAKFYMYNNRHKLAALYFMEARDCYRKWGAVAKVKHLEENYPRYLSMSFPGSMQGTGTISSASTDTTGEFLDVTSIIKASQALSGEVQLARLLEKMMQILVENAGAQKSMLIENIDGGLLVQAEGSTDGVSGILKKQPIEESGNVPLSVINYVARSEKKLVFDNLSKDPNYSSDDYIQKHHPKSVVCFPIIRKEKLSAIIYLENNLVEGAFTPERMNVLNTLSSQIAISIENARIYRDLDELNKGLEQKVAERTRELEEMDKAKSRFFANISHEFRTPLTLIMGPLEQILSNNPEKEMKAKARLMLRNSQRLLNLINQLLELARLDSGKMKLEVSEQNIVPFLKSIVLCFESMADQNNVGLFFLGKEENISLFFDPEKLEKIITNLLSNAFNYTPAGGEITVSVRKIGDADGFPSGCVEISVRDTGTGIPGNQLPHIFDRFYRVEGSHEYKRKGSGIGLALTKELVELHHGEIDVQSSCRDGDNRGTEFFLRLPMGDGHLEPGEIVEIAAPESLPVSKGPSPAYAYTTGDVEEEDAPDEGTEVAPGEPRTETEEKSLVLVVDDNPDVRIYIKGALDPHFTVVEATDGKEGIRRAKEILPDLIVSDVMMPEIDGYELCRTLKNDILTSHIPIILLTARVSEESVLEGLETGADDYITKPFSTSVLTVRVRNLIDLRRQLQLERKNRMTFQPEEIPVSPIDEKFYKKLQDTVEMHLSDPDFNVEAISRELEMSQATLWRKINALTGKTPTLFIRTYRLKRAAQLLGARAGSVSQVAVNVGFSDPSYFAKCFKEQFNRLPSELSGAVRDEDALQVEPVPPPESPGPGKEVVLVVEDSEDARNYIRESLETDYRVVEAVDGSEGIARALEIIPDLIVSDVMMPGTDGYELCGALKKDVRTSHIPIVMLTARATEASMIRGLETGADDYVTKPFNTNILRARIKNLIGLRRFLQTKRNREMTLLPIKVSESKIDEKFMKEVDSAIAKNLSDPDFNVEQLAKKLYMSSATLYRKIQALTGEVPSEYIRSYRLRRAARLFKDNFGSVTEVAFEVGFNSRTYFTRCFKEKFFQLPSVFMAVKS